MQSASYSTTSWRQFSSLQSCCDLIYVIWLGNPRATNLRTLGPAECCDFQFAHLCARKLVVFTRNFAFSCKRQTFLQRQTQSFCKRNSCRVNLGCVASTHFGIVSLFFAACERPTLAIWVCSECWKVLLLVHLKSGTCTSLPVSSHEELATQALVYTSKFRVPGNEEHVCWN